MKRGPRIGFALASLFVAALVGIGVFRALPARWWPVDTGGGVVTVLLAAAGVLLLLDHRRAPQVSRVAGLVTLACGLALTALLAITASYLSGIYGAAGKGFATVYALVALLVLPYLVAFPAALLVWVRGATRPS